MMKKVLVTGGYGYVGSHTIERLCAAGHIVDSFDLNHSKNDISKYIRKNIIGDIRNDNYIGSYDAVVHLAALLDVKESMNIPWDYVRTNIIGTKNVLRSAATDNFIFASSCSTFTPEYSPYGQTKLLGENLVREHASNYTIFRIFNVAGNNGIFDEIVRTRHLIQVAAEAAVGVIPHMYLYGTDYNTKDGTSMRDYIHVSDLANAIALAVETPKNTAFECAGTGVGYSCREVIETMKYVSGINFNVIEAEKRKGDPPSSLIPDNIDNSDYVYNTYDLEEICFDAYNAARKYK
jgi:UDP-glucose 4-epimerase